MKKITFIFILLYSFVAYAQNYKITYAFSLAIQTDTIKNIDKRAYYERYFLKEAPKTFGILWTNTHGSFFEQEGQLKAILSENTYLQNRFSSKKQQKIYFPSVLYTDAPVNYYFKNFSDFNWEITPETKSINGYVCYKALGVDVNANFMPQYIEAWFCPEIPLPYGPDNYAGLPGLIFEVYRRDGQGIHWTLKSIEKNKTKDFYLPDPVDTEHYEQAYTRTNKVLDLIYKRK